MTRSSSTFNTAALLGVLLFFEGAIICLVLGLGVLAVIAAMFGGFAIAFLYCLSIRKRLYTLPVVISAVVLIAITGPALWINTNGSRGPMPLW